jgi:hypothetical protein
VDVGELSHVALKSVTHLVVEEKKLGEKGLL